MFTQGRGLSCPQPACQNIPAFSFSSIDLHGQKGCVLYITEKVKGCCIREDGRPADFVEIEVAGEKGEAECSDESSPYVLSPYYLFLEFMVP
jgi:hypothetical protein